MISFTNVYYNNDGSINEQELINDIQACKILIKEYKKRGDGPQETLIRWEFMKRKAFAEVHHIDYTIPVK